MNTKLRTILASSQRIRRIKPLLGVALIFSLFNGLVLYFVLPRDNPRFILIFSTLFLTLCTILIALLRIYWGSINRIREKNGFGYQKILGWKYTIRGNKAMQWIDILKSLLIAACTISVFFTLILLITLM